MTMNLNPYVMFPGNAREAMETYHSIFGGDLTVMTFAETGMPNAPDGVMHSSLTTPQGFMLMASDTPPGMEHQAGNAVAISLSGDDEALRGYWAALAEGGTVVVPFERQMWGDEFGQLVDRFGASWMVNLGTGEQA